MLRFSRSSSFIVVARLVTLAFCHPFLLAPVLFAGPASAQGIAPTRVAILPFDCADSLGGAAFGEAAAKAVALEMMERSGFEVTSLSDVKRMLTSANIQPPFIGEDLQRLGKALAVDQVIRGRVTAAAVTAKGETAAAELTTKSVSTETGQVLYETTGKGDYRRPAGGPRTDADLKAEALKQAARDSVGQLTILKGLAGIVVSKPTTNTARLSLGSEAGMHGGAQVALFHKGAKVAEGKVTEVSAMDCIVAVEPIEAGRNVLVGDRFRALSNPTPTVEKPALTTEELSSKSRKKHKHQFLLGLLLAAGLYLLLRDHGGTPAAANATAAGLTVVAAPNSIAADGLSTSTITVTARDANNNPVADGSTLTLTTTLGTITTNVITSAGQATATLIAGTVPGLAVVTATMGNVNQTTTVQFTSTAVSPVTMSSDAQSIPAGGSAATNITATFRDASNNPVPNGSTVVWSTNLGTLGPARTRGVGRQNQFTTTTTNGTTSVSLTSSTTPGTAVVTATLQGTTTKSTITITFTTFAVQVTALPQEIVADGNSISTITVTVTDSAGNPAADGTIVNFATTLGTITTSSVTSAGQATAVLTSGTVAGTARVTVQVLDDQGQVVATANATNVGFAAGPAFQLGVGTQTLNLKALDTVNATNQVTVVVKDQNGNPVRNGTVVAFAADKGAVDGTAVTTNGTATVTWRSIQTDHQNPQAGIVTITATTTTEGGGVVTGQAQFMVTGDPAQIIIVSVVPGTINVSTATTEAGKSIITVRVQDRNGNPVIAGTVVNFATTLGTITGSTTTVDGILDSPAQATLTAGDTPGTATVTITSGSAQTPTTVNFVTP